jgi:hypothetical protein
MPIAPHAAIFTIGVCDPVHGKASEHVLRLHPDEERRSARGRFRVHCNQTGAAAVQRRCSIQSLRMWWSVCPELPQQRLFWNKGSIYQLDVSSLQGAGNPRCVMTTLQAICFGAMLAWTPSLVVLALLLREAPLDEFQHDPS